MRSSEPADPKGALKGGPNRFSDARSVIEGFDDARNQVSNDIKQLDRRNRSMSGHLAAPRHERTPTAARRSHWPYETAVVADSTAFDHFECGATAWSCQHYQPNTIAEDLSPKTTSARLRRRCCVQPLLAEAPTLELAPGAGSEHPRVAAVCGYTRLQADKS